MSAFSPFLPPVPDIISQVQRCTQDEASAFDPSYPPAGSGCYAADFSFHGHASSACLQPFYGQLSGPFVLPTDALLGHPVQPIYIAASAAKDLVIAVLGRTSPAEIPGVLRVVLAELQNAAQVSSTLPEPADILSPCDSPSEMLSPEAFWLSSSTDVSSRSAESPVPSPYFVHFDEEGIQRFVCCICGKAIKEHRSGGASNFWSHYDLHDPNRARFPCDWPDCGSSFSRERDRKAHVEKHRLRTRWTPC
ncbi:hypothetical protein L226DRAFT_570592 [Lentinus tigrinus ALCF2SS1-7]|uniref:uncharacterized protein n=1 Tax=Lentinus tigrinus ALCF2SS1-7 TaxID=1328758 RepID=UPI001165D60F|nr:hypothetical protein L226DRAFT_570592 [Lentinus tigrinus ALCF2SS1-7]